MSVKSNRHTCADMNCFTGKLLLQPHIQSGLFVKATVNGIPCNLLVDTGATLTILSYKVYENLTKPEEDELTPVTQSIILADGALLQTKGKCDFLISIGNSEFEVVKFVQFVLSNFINPFCQVPSHLLSMLSISLFAWDDEEKTAPTAEDIFSALAAEEKEEN